MNNNNTRKWAELIDAFKLDLSAPRQTAGGAANDTEYEPVDVEEFFRVCRDGKRTARLLRCAGSLLRSGLSSERTTELMLAVNGKFNDPPLEIDKVRDTIASIARIHARNHPQDQDPGAPLFDLRAASVGRFLDCEAPEREWVLQDCVPLGKAALLVAPGGTGKSMLILQMAYDIATGRKTFSPWAPAKPGKVIVLSAEDEEEELHRRFRRLVDDDLRSPDRVDLEQILRDNFYLVPRVGEDNLITREVGGEMMVTSYVDRVLKSIEGVEDVRLIVLDPLARFRGGEENAAEDTTRCVEAMELLAKRSGAAVLATHHTNKVSANGSEPSQNASRGSSALVDGVRLVINLSNVTSGRHHRSTGQDQLLEVRITKGNYGPIGEPLLLQRDSLGRLLPISADEAEARRQRDLFAAVVRLLADAEAEGRRFNKSTFAAAHAGVDGVFGMGQNALKQYIQSLVDGGVLEVDAGKGKFLKVRKTDPASGVPSTKKPK